MRVKNKKTGEIKECVVIPVDSNGYPNEYQVFEKGKSLAELNEEWEDYEGPKVGYIIDPMEEDYVSADDAGYEESDVERAKELGIWLETKEEAELAVRKLKAWKRLKDKGFRFTLTPGVGSLDVTPDKFQIEINADMPAKWFCCDAVQKDLDDCFGGEE